MGKDKDDAYIIGLENMLRACQKQFRYYEAQHIAKNTKENRLKAAVNARMAHMIEETLTNGA